MIVYTVHEPEPHAQSIEERADNVVFVKEGFTWRGFSLRLSSLLSLFRHCHAMRISWVFRLAVKGLHRALLSLFLMLLVGFEWNDLRRWLLGAARITLF